MADFYSKLIIPAGTQVVTRADLRDAAGVIVRPRGAVGRKDYQRIRLPYQNYTYAK